MLRRQAYLLLVCCMFSLIPISLTCCLVALCDKCLLVLFFYYSSSGNLVYSLELAKSKQLIMSITYVIICGFNCSVKPFAQAAYPAGKPATAVSAGEVGPLQTAPPPVWEGRAIATHKLRLVEYSAFMESQNRDEAVSVKI